MDNSKKAPETIDEYIAAYPEEVQSRLQALRAAIKAVVPEATEVISYGMPTFRYNGNLVYFGAAKHHIGFYPTPNGMEAFKERLKPYASGKGSAQFPYDQPIPFDLVADIVKYRLEENKNKKKK